ncbi:MAG: D-tyrosyl-tRNA(Tyr) deacylase [Ruminococcaceae bacterium]|nr:D-tyrosyl-tRNA(Tyr) deacylase [Oscillospiraceae bacterium]
MIAVLQRAKRAAVRVEGAVTGEIGKGLLVLLGVAEGDSEKEAEMLAAKVLRCRIFEDENGKMNRSVTDVSGGVLVVSNFTLLANYRRGNRPDFMGAAAPARANELYTYFTALVRREVDEVGTGVFGAEMEVELVGDGPVTIVMNTDVLKQSKKES